MEQSESAYDLWPTVRPQNMVQLGINTAYGSAVGALIAKISQRFTIERGAIYGGALYLIIAGVLYVTRLSDMGDDPHGMPNGHPALSLDKTINNLLNTELKAAQDVGGPALDIRKLTWGSIDLQPYVKCGSGPQPPPGLAKYGHIIQKYC